MKSAALLRRFLEAYWLRPENALWMTLRSLVLGSEHFESPSADVSCGDGVFSFLHAGGVFDPAFDVFSSVGNLDRVRGEHADMFDHVDQRYRPLIVEAPHARLGVGTDLKETLLAKAQRLGFYDRLIRHDNNDPLPFPDDAFATLYCNAVYWVRQVEPFLGELARVVRCGGRVILHVKLEAMRGYTLVSRRGALGDPFLELMGRGRIESWPALTDRGEWEARFGRAGLRIVEVSPIATRTHAHLWDIGLRPIAPMLVRMTEALTADTRADIKRDWVDLFLELLEPFCNPSIDLCAGSAEPAELQYVLKPA